MNNLKSFEYYWYFSSNTVRRILLKEGDQNHVYLKVPHHLINWAKFVTVIGVHIRYDHIIQFKVWWAVPPHHLFSQKNL